MCLDGPPFALSRLLVRFGLVTMQSSNVEGSAKSAVFEHSKQHVLVTREKYAAVGRSDDVVGAVERHAPEIVQHILGLSSAGLERHKATGLLPQSLQ